MRYSETKKEIENIRRDNGEILFRMAISHLIDVGVRHLTDENIKATCESIMEEDDSNHFMTNDFKCEIVRIAGMLAKFDHIHLLVYISENVEYDVF